MQDPLFEETSDSETADQHRCTTLCQLLKRIGVERLQGIREKKSIVVENVDKSLTIPGDEDMLAFVIGGLKTNAMYFTSGCTVRVETVYHKEELQHWDTASTSDDSAKAIIIVFSGSPRNAA